MQEINRFTGDYAFLSNFYESTIRLPDWHSASGVDAPTVEHAFQSCKALDRATAVAIARASTASGAKRMGRAVNPIRPGWDAGRKLVMVSLLRLKFAPGTPLARLLLATGNSLLVEGNNWGDRYWGMTSSGGENWLGRCLMLVRAELDVMPDYTNLPRVGETAEGARVNRGIEADARTTRVG